MTTDTARSLAQRLAIADPGRFVIKETKLGWMLGGMVEGREVWMEPTDPQRVWWQFFGPLAQEYGVTQVDCVSDYNQDAQPVFRYTLLEALAVATVEAVERKVKR